MKLKHVLWATAVWTALVVAGSAGLLWYVLSHAPGPDLDRRAGMAGQGVATVAVIGYVVIWLPFCIKAGRRRREAGDQARERESERRKNRRPLND